jgi:hypothetical protein
MTDILEHMDAFTRNIPGGVQLHVFLDQQIEAGDAFALQLVTERAMLMTDQDRTRASAYMEIGYYTGLAEDHRLAAWLLTLEMGQMLELDALASRFARYSPNQALFQALPNLWAEVRDEELIGYQPARRVRHDGVIHWDGAFVRLDPYLTPDMVANLAAAFPTAPLYVRLDPDFTSGSRPREYLVEAVLVPADPSWWRTLGIHRGEAKGSHYEIQDPKDPKSDMQSFLDYRVRGARTLEVHAQRTKDDYLSMMVEELVDLRETSGFLLGRCIHWDTEALKDTAPEVALVKHLDLAINVYSGVAAAQRLSKSVARGRVTDAIFRTHLLRIEGIPAQALLAVAEHFFVSSVLLAEWFKDQFRRPE